MPAISIFFGFVVQMCWRDHPPPHVHVFYQGHEALIGIADGVVIAGGLPPGRPAPHPGLDRAAQARIDGQLGAWNAQAVLRARSGSRRRMIELVKVIEARALDDRRLWLRFSNGREGTRDLTDVLAEGGEMVEPLRDPVLFGRVFVECGVPAWPNGFDLDAIALHREMEEAGLLTVQAA